jgi:hypothetical protein
MRAGGGRPGAGWRIEFISYETQSFGETTLFSLNFGRIFLVGNDFSWSFILSHLQAFGESLKSLRMGGCEVLISFGRNFLK